MIDHSKLRRERTKDREDIRLQEDHLFGLVSYIYVDGRKDATIKSNEQNGKYYRETIVEEHYVIVGDPHEYYLSHVTPAGGTGLHIAEAIFQVIEGIQ